MARSGKNTARLIREKAAELFFEKGYHATSLREVAAASGLKVGSLYNHIASKEHLLLQVMGGTMDDLVDAQRAVLTDEVDPIERLRAAVGCHVRFHAERAQEVFIGNSNLGALSEDARQKIIAKRADYERIIRTLIEDAGHAGLASVIDPRLHTYSIVAQGTNVASWYRPGGRMTLDEIVAAYTKFALRELQVDEADARVDVAMGLAVTAI